MRSKRLFRTSLLLTLAVLVPLLSIPLIIPLAHATSPSLFNSIQNGPCGTLAGCTTQSISGVLTNMVIMVHWISNGGGGAGGCSSGNNISDSFGDTYTLQLTLTSAGNAGSCIFTAFAKQSGTLTVNYPGTQNSSTGASQVLVDLFSGVLLIGATGSNQVVSTTCTVSCSNTLPLAIQSGSMVFEGFDIQSVNLNAISFPADCPIVSQGSSQFIINNIACQPILTQMVGGQDVYSAIVSAPATNNYVMSFKSSATCSSSNCWSTQNYAVELQGTPVTQTGLISQCYGNCGSPAVTLANTNSTHTIAFNQSITVFYEFQSNLNGFLLNVTTSLAKSYGNINGFAVGVYTVPSCPQGQTPFLSSCPGLLQKQNGPPQVQTTLPKGKISFFGLNVPVSNGQWVGIALSGVYSGLDLNDTNTNVNLFQTNEGKLSPIIQAASSLGNSKMGLWAFISGNIVVGSPPPGTASGQTCGPGLDSILGCAVNSLCTLVTAQCQTGSSMFLIIILTIISIATLLGIFSYWLPNLSLTTRGMGEFAVLIFIGWFTAFAAFGLLLPYMMILMFFVVAWLFLGRSKGTGPI